MHWYQSALLIGALIAGALAWNVPRAVFWLGIGGLSFVASSMWHDAGFPYGAAFGAATNLAVCFALYAYAQQKWELRYWNCFHLMIVIDILYLWNVIDSHWIFAVSLELANWLAILLIATVGTMERFGGSRLSDRSHSRGVRGLARSLYAKRTAPPFWQA